MIFQGSKIHVNPYTPKISMLILLTAFHTFHIFLVEFNRFPELSRTSRLFPGLSSPGKCPNKIPGLSRFSRTRTNRYREGLMIITRGSNIFPLQTHLTSSKNFITRSPTSRGSKAASSPSVNMDLVALNILIFDN